MARILLLHGYPYGVEGVCHKKRAHAMLVEQALLDQGHSYHPVSTRNGMPTLPENAGTDYDALVVLPERDGLGGNVLAALIEKSFPRKPVVVVLREEQAVPSPAVENATVVRLDRYFEQSLQAALQAFGLAVGYRRLEFIATTVKERSRPAP